MLNAYPHPLTLVLARNQSTAPECGTTDVLVVDRLDAASDDTAAWCLCG